VLSRFAGAAEQMREALLVNPYDVPATAQAIQQALHMPLPERRERHAALLASITRESASQWRQHFLEELAATPAPGERVLSIAPLSASA
jgi:trehalose 6-phosphate synthase